MRDESLLTFSSYLLSPGYYAAVAEKAGRKEEGVGLILRDYLQSRAGCCCRSPATNCPTALTRCGDYCSSCTSQPCKQKKVRESGESQESQAAISPLKANRWVEPLTPIPPQISSTFSKDQEESGVSLE